MTEVRGVPLALHPSPDYVSDAIRSSGDFYEAPILDEVALRLRFDAIHRDPGLLLDVGAMIGNHAAYLAAFVPHRVIHAFEPEPGNRALLTANVERFPTVRVHHYALSDQRGRLEMAYSSSNRGWGTVIATDPTVVPGMHAFSAEAVALDDLGFHDVRLIKIDVERHERYVLAGARRTIDRCRPLLVVEDWNRDLGPVMSALGYRLGADFGHPFQTFIWEPA